MKLSHLLIAGATAVSFSTIAAAQQAGQQAGQQQPGAAAGATQQPGAAAGTTQQPGAAAGTTQQPGAAAGATQQPGAAAGTTQQPGAAAGATQPGAQQHDEQTIRQVQEKLKEKGHDVMVDGQMGPKTQDALREFQKKEGIAETGQLDQQTLSALGVDTPAAGVTAPAATPGPTAPADPAKPADPAAKPAEPAAPGATAPQGDKKY